MASEKIKITIKELEDIYDIEEPKVNSDQDEVTIEEVHDETWEEATERIDKKKYGTKS